MSLLRPSRSVQLPAYGRFLLQVLQFQSREMPGLSKLDKQEWIALLNLCDRSQLTLLVGHLAKPYLPKEVAERIRQDSQNYGIRLARLRNSVAEIGRAFSDRSIPVVLLKGPSHAPHFTSDPLLRAQGDIDLWCKPDRIEQAKAALEELGYRPYGKSQGRHLDPMIREKSWTWDGDYFAPDLPIPIDLHYQLWDEKKEFLPGPDELAIWDRTACVPSQSSPTMRQLSLPDVLLFATLHLLMHLLHGDLRLQRAWEIGFFLQHHQEPKFWATWHDLYPDDVRQLQTVIFLLAAEWFGCLLPEQVRAEGKNLSPEVLLWLRDYAWSPVESIFHPNKHELWLNLALLRTKREKALVLIRRLLPLHAMDLSTRSASPHQPAMGRLIQRAKHHLLVFPKTCLSAVRWWASQQHRARE